MTFGELAGRIPLSLIPKVDFQKFVKKNKLPVMEDQAIQSISVPASIAAPPATAPAATESDKVEVVK